MAQDQVLEIRKPTTQLVPINISGFTGEADAVLRFDLSVLGLETTTADKADYLISGTANGQLEGRLKRGGGGAEVFARIYSSGDARSQAHAFANDIVKVVRDAAPIFLSRIAFCQVVGGNREVFVSDYDGHNPVQMTHDTLVATPTWSPGGRKLFYTSWKSGFSQILEQDLTTGKRSVFSGSGGGNFSPAVSPDGRKVAMVVGKRGSPNLYVCDSDGGNLRELTEGSDDVSSPTWSPDSQEICYVQRPGATLHTININGGRPVALHVGIAANLTAPDWSPDGKKIVFTSGSGNFHICVMNADGSNAENLLVSGEEPCWAPNSRTVIFTKRVGNQRVLSLLDVPTKHVKDMGQISGSCSQPAWAR